MVLDYSLQPSPEPSAWDVLPQDPVLLLEILNGRLLAPVDPPRSEEDNGA